MVVSKSKPTIYLAGGMERAGEAGKVWRQEITPHLNSLGYHVWDPYTEEMNVGASPEMLARLKREDYAAYLKYMKKIVHFDIASLVRCAAVAVKIDRSVLEGAGTYGELTICALYNVPTYAWIDLPNDRYDVPGWAMGCINHYTYDKEDFYKMIPYAGDRPRLPYEKHMEDYIANWEKLAKKN